MGADLKRRNAPNRVLQYLCAITKDSHEQYKADYARPSDARGQT